MSDNFELELPGTIGKLQAGIYAILKAEGSQLDARIPVLCENQLDLLQKINEAVAQVQPGICAIVRSPRMLDTKFGANLFFDDCTVVIRILENVLLNRAEGGSKIPAQLAAEQVALQICNKAPAGFGCVLTPYDIADVSNPQQTGILTYEVRAKTMVGLGLESEQGD